MSCPDEDTFARFVQGLLPTQAASEIERHVDGCARCADLAAEFGSLYAEPAPAASDAAVGLPWGTLAVAATLHAAWTVVVQIWPGALDSLLLAPFAAPYALYLKIWGLVGCVVALSGAIGLARERSWARTVALAYAVVSLPSVIMTPLAIFVLAALRQRDSGKRPAS